MTKGMKIEVLGSGRAIIDGKAWWKVDSPDDGICLLTEKGIRKGDLVYRPVEEKGDPRLRILASELDPLTPPRRVRY